MKKENFLWLSAIVGLMMCTNVLLTGCDGKDSEPDPEPIPPIEVIPITPGKYEKDVATDIESLKKGSNFYIVAMDKFSVSELSEVTVVPPMIRTIDVWENGQSLEGGTTIKSRDGDGALGTKWGATAPDAAWIAFDVKTWDKAGTDQVWNGGAIVAIINEFPEEDGGVPNLKPITDSPDEYYFHFAVKSPPTELQNEAMLLFLYSDGTPTKDGGGGGVGLLVGPTRTSLGSGDGTLPSNMVIKLDNYTHDNEWHHFEVPVSELTAKGYSWTQPLHGWTGDEGRAYLVGFQSLPHVAGTEINLDAVFFYKRPAAQ
jgi:hypothetical protein